MALLGTASAWAAPLPTTTFPETLAGSYQALLYSEDGDAGSPVGLVTLAVTTKGALTGKLTTVENKTYPLKAALSYSTTENPAPGAPVGSATAPTIQIVRGKTTPNLSVNLSIKDFEENDTVDIFVNEEATTLGSTENGFKLITFAKGALPYAAAGAYTMALTPADVPGPNDPSGSGYAAVTIDAKGLLKMTGKTADGTAFTASIPAGPDYRYVAFINPYKRVDSFLAGKIQLTEDEGNGYHMIAAESGYDFQWKKASLLPKTTDKSYRAGFGPLDLFVSIEKWTLPGKGETLAQVLGTENFQFDLDLFGADLDLVNKYLGMIPKKLTVDAKGNLVPVYGDAFAPTDLKEWAKIWTGKVDPKTGIYTGTLTLSDLVDLDGVENKVPIKFIKRKLAIAGILFNVDNPEIPRAFGFFTLPPIDPKTELIKAGGFEFGRTLEDLGLGAPDGGDIPPGTAGNYTSLLTQAVTFDFSGFPGAGGVGINVTGTMKGIPANNSTVKFFIAPDLSYIIFNGRKVPLMGNSLPVALLFSDATASNVKNNLTVTVYLNTTTGLVTGYSASYFQLLSARYSLYNRTVSAFVPGVAVCTNVGTPAKVP
ncbi:hypothetical protein GCM10023213_15240 [Prosthecobacter algae]|uniref:Calx-beta domain-containing protein n=2 Tax=Prosthecobacter algae TaxID=1144682 RepID=A0ABP9P4K4_9BACT